MPVKKNNLPGFALMVGVISIAFALTGTSLPIGALGIIIAIISRGNEPMEKPAKIGLALSMLGITIGICMYIWIYFLMQSADFNAFLQQYLAAYGA